MVLFYHSNKTILLLFQYFRISAAYTTTVKYRTWLINSDEVDEMVLEAFFSGMGEVKSKCLYLVKI